MSSSNMSTSYLQAFLPKSLHPFVTLSYPLPSAPSSLPLPLRHLLSSSHPAAPTGKAYTRLAAVAGTAEKLYGKGPKDLYFAVFCAIAFTVLREIMLRYILSAFARAWLMSSYRKSKGASKSETGRDRRMKRRDRKKMEHTVTRFAEQGWSFIYCTVFWSMGMLILYRLPSPLSPQSLWGSYPQTSLPGLTKFYYLAQLGWWFHQIYVINSEKRRKDHWQMFGHHLLTIALITTSYATHFTRVGTVIHALMDFCDILLPLAKMLRYLSLLKLCDFTFVVFLVSWLLSRQIGLSLVIKTAYFDAPKYIPFKWDPKNGYYLTEGAYYGFIGAITILLCLASVWFCMACMVAVRVVRGEGAEDSRSDDEEEDELEVDVSEDGSTLSDVPESSSTVYDKAPAVSSVDAEVRKRK